ncbi:hypothetical protein [Marinospirillum sp.]|uniref:hypothetical protein n=1 Tax=Marinospirillum sp. TaxID=2183934 RepID=UPI00384EB981
MDISGVSPELIALRVAEQEKVSTRLEAQAGLVKETLDQQANAVMQLMEAVPLPEGRSGHNVNLTV